MADKIITGTERVTFTPSLKSIYLFNMINVLDLAAMQPLIGHPHLTQASNMNLIHLAALLSLLLFGCSQADTLI